jgi:alpha-mannosidase
MVRFDVRRGAAAGVPAGDAVRGTAAGLHARWGVVTPQARGFRVRPARPARVLGLALTSERDEGDTYTIEPVPGDRLLTASWGRPRIVWPGPLAAAAARPFRLGRRVRGTTFIRIDAGSPLVRIAIEGVNAAGRHRVRLRLPLGARAATADMAFGAVTRPSVSPEDPPFPRERPPTTAPMHRYVSAGGWTVFARGLHEYELLPDGSLAVTLLRAVGDLSRGTLRARPGHAGWPTATPGAQALGPFRAELALAPVGVTARSPASDWDVIEALAEAFHAPLAGHMCRTGVDLPGMVPGPELTGAGLAFKALKPREAGPGIVLRCVNLTRRTQRGAWSFPIAITRAFQARLDETVELELRPSPDRRRVPFTAGPRSIVTTIVEW